MRTFLLPLPLDHYAILGVKIRDAGWLRTKIRV
jgi:hypothetical protein